MVKKTKPATQQTADTGELIAAVKESAQQIWLAGLGAFSKAQEEGSKVFDVLVKEGKSIQKRTRAMAEDKLGEVTGRVGRAADDASRQASLSWDRLEQVFEERVARALNRLGVPTDADVRTLIARVERLDASVQALGAKAARSPRAAAARKPAAKPGAKPVAKATRSPRRTAAKKAPKA